MNNQIRLVGLFILGICLFWALGIVSAQTVNAPSNLTISFDLSSPKKIVLNWQDNSDNEYRFYLERSLNNGASWQVLSNIINSDTITFSTTDLVCETNYQFRIRARVLPSTYSSYSNVASATSGDCPPPLNLPTNINAYIRDSYPFFSWMDTNTDETHYELGISIDDGASWRTANYPHANNSYGTTLNTFDVHSYCGSGLRYRLRAYRAYDNSYSDYVYTAEEITVPCATVIAEPICSIAALPNGSLQQFSNSLHLSNDGSTIVGSARDAYMTQYIHRSNNYTAFPYSTFTMMSNADGSRFAFSSPDDILGENPNFFVQVYLWDDGDVSQLTHIPMQVDWDVQVVDMSDDGSRVVFVTRSDILTGNPAPAETNYIYLWDETDGIELIASGGWSFGNGTPDATMGLSISGDGSTIVYVEDSRGIFGIWNDTDGLRFLPALDEAYSLDADSYHNPILHLNEDGSKMAFRASTETYADLFLWDASTGQYQRLTNNNSVVTVNGISADGQRIFFSALADLTGENPDLSRDFFFWQNGEIFQITSNLNRADFNSLIPMGQLMSADGTRAIAISRYPEPTTTSNHSSGQYQLIRMTCQPTPAIPPALVTPSALTTNLSDGTISINWTDNASNESHYLLEQSVNGGTSWNEVAELPANTNNYSVSDLDCGTEYRYRVRAHQSSNGAYSPYSNVDSEHSSACAAPVAPSELLAVEELHNSISLVWRDNSLDETNFRLERSNEGSTWVEIAQIPADSESYADTTVTCNTEYQYRIRAYRSSDESYSAYTESFLAQSDICPLYAASDLTLTAIESTYITLSWVDNSSDEYGYYVESSWGGMIAYVEANITTAAAYDLSCETDYQFRIVTVRDVQRYSAWVNVTTPPCLPEDPTGLVALETTATSINLSWNDNASDELGYRLERRVWGSASWTEIASLPADSTSYSDTGLDCETGYSYRVRAYLLSDNTFSGYSYIVDRMTEACSDPTLPATPTDMEVTEASETGISIAWQDNALDESEYRLERWAYYEDVWVELAVLPADTSSYSDTGLDCDQYYHYRVRAYRLSDDKYSYYSQTSSYTTECVGPSRPEIPFALSIYHLDTNRLRLNWMDVSDTETEYRVERSTNAGLSWSEIAVLPANSKQYIDNNLSCGIVYQYRVRNYRSDFSLYSHYSNVATGQIVACPSAPTGLTISNSTPTSISLSWADNTLSETGYRVERSSDGGANWSELVQLAANSTGYSDTGIDCNSSYDYRVRAYRSGDAQFSTYSNVVTGTTELCAAPLAASDLTVSANSHNSISLAWTDNASDETEYRLERSTDAGTSWTELTILPADSTSYTDTTNCLDIYQYRVRAYRSGDAQFSVYSDVVAATCAAPLAPTGLTVTESSQSSISLAWTDNAVNETAYRLERSTDAGANWSLVVALGSDATSYSDTNLSCTNSYQYRVVAARSGDSQNSAYSASITATCAAPLAPTGLTVTETAETSISLSWTDASTNETSYALERSADNGTSWTEIVQFPADATSYTDNDLTCNSSYDYRVRAYRSGDAQFSAYSSIATGTTELCAAPLAASDLTVSANSHNSISLAWTDNASDETEYRLERSTDAGTSWTELTVLPADSTSYTDTTNCLDIYQYRVRAYRSGDAQFSAYSDVVAATCAAPLAPTGLTVTESNQTSISLAWTDNAVNETAYRLERSTDAGANWSLVVSLGSDATSYSDTNLSCTNSYQYRVVAARSGDSQNSAYSDSIPATCAAPLAPTDLAVTETAESSISLAWTDASTNETSYLLERSADNGTSWTEIVQFPADATSYTDNDLTCNSSYDYRVRAYRSGDAQFSAYSTVATGTTDNCSAPAAPTALTITGTSQTSISLAWTDNASNESEFRLERSDDGISWTEIAMPAADSTSYTDTGLSCATTYDYRLRAYRSGDAQFSAYSNVVTGTSDNCPAPDAPTALTVTGTTQTSVSLTWTDNASDETNYAVERSLDGISWTEIQALAANSSIYTDNGVNCDTAYQYRVRAYRSEDSQFSAYSNAATGTTTACPAPLAASDLSVTGTSSSSLSLAWTDNASDETSYSLERSADGISWSEIAMPAANSTSYSDTSVTCNTSYDYRIRAYRSGDAQFSAYSNVATGTTSICLTLNAPTNIQQTANSQTGMSLSWTDNSTNESGYEIERSLDGTNWTLLSSLPANSASYTDSGLTCSTGYQYRIRSNHLGTASYSPYGSSGVLSTASCPALIPSVLSSTGATQNSISLSWTVDSNGTSFTLAYYNGSAWVNLGIFPSTTTSYTHTGPSCNRSYQYQVTTFRVTDSASVTSSAFSTSTSACPPLANPNAPVVVNTEPALVSLQIPAMPATATSMSLERSTDGLSWTNLGNVSSNYFDTAVVCGSSYQYRLVAVRSGDGVTSTSTNAVAVTDACPIPNVVGVYRAGLWIFVDSNNTAMPVNSFNFGDSGWQALVGDWDGDGIDGVGIYRNGEFALRNLASADSPENRFNFGNAEAGWQALVGDWNGDGIDSVGLYKDGLFILSDDNSNMNYRFNFGFQQAGWQVVAGDWDGNGADGIALYKEGLWMLANDVNNPDASSFSISFGPAQAGWTAIVGDWNGDGQDSIGLYGNGIWRMRVNNVNDATETSLNFGQMGDIPLAIFEN